MGADVRPISSNEHPLTGNGGSRSVHSIDGGTGLVPLAQPHIHSVELDDDLYEFDADPPLVSVTALKPELEPSRYPFHRSADLTVAPSVAAGHPIQYRP